MNTCFFFQRWQMLPLLILTSALLLLATDPASAAADRTRPTTPTNLRMTAITPTSVSLAWNPSTDNSGSFTYTVRELNSGQTRTAPQTHTTLIWTGLQPSKTYRFVVFARDAAGNQSYNSNTLTVKTPAAPPTPTPANFRVTGVTVSSVSLAWDAVNGASSYEIYRYTSGVTPIGGLLTSYTASFLAPGATHQFQIRALGPNGPSAWSAPLLVATPPDTAPPTVPVVSGTAISPGVVQLTWSESTDETAYVGYNVYINGQPARSMLPDNSIPRLVTIRNLRANTTYEFTVKSYDQTGNFSAASTPLVLTMPTGADTVPPAAPQNLQVLPNWGNGISTVGLGWAWAADNVGTMAYEIYMDDVLVGETLLDVHYGGVETSFIVRSITPGTTHTFHVKARDEAGNVSAPSNPVTVTLLPSSDTIPPTPPSVFWASDSPGCGFVDFMWDIANDNVDEWFQLEFEVYEDGIFRGMWRDEAFEASFGRHIYTIRAVDRAGNRSAPSNEMLIDNDLDC